VKPSHEQAAHIGGKEADSIRLDDAQHGRPVDVGRMPIS